MRHRPVWPLLLLGLICVLAAWALPAQAGWLWHRARPACPLPDCAAAAGLPAVNPMNPEVERAAIEQVLRDQVTAWNKGDLEGFMRGYWNAPELTFFSGNTRTQGWQATLDRYKKKYQSEGKQMGQLTFSELKVELLGPESAFVRGRFEVVLGKEKPTGLFTLIFRRTPDGWRIIHDHTSG